MAGGLLRRCGALAACLSMWLVGAGALAGNIPVSTVAGLRAALATASAGTEVRLAPGDYVLDSPLVIPDRVALTGSGQMAAGAGGRDGGTPADGPATLLVRGAWSGNAIELGHRSALRRLRVVDEAGADGGRVAPDMARNLVVVGSRHPGDLVEATIEECELSTRQPFGVGRTEPLGRAVGVWTRNPAGAGPAHTGATVRLKLVRSMIVAPRSNALMAINFAALGTVEIGVVDSRIEGALSAAGGTSRPDPVTGARTTIRSRRSEYVAAGEFNRFGWHLFGGSGVPHPGFATPAGADDNRLHVKSEGDRIEGFQVGILAAAGRRVGGLSGPSSGNRLDLELRGLVIRTAGEQAADVRWYGALAEPGPGGEDRLPPGEGNVMTVRITGTAGSGPRGNRYAGQEGPAPAARDHAGNGLWVRGTADRFRRVNPGLSPVPSDGHFTEGGR